MFIQYEEPIVAEEDSAKPEPVPLRGDKKRPPVKLKLRSTNRKVDESFRKMKSFAYRFAGKRIPSNFDGRLVWGNLLPSPGNQGQCGSCWAWATTKTLSARYNIQSSGRLKKKIDLSPTMPLLCDLGQQHAKTDKEFKKMNKEAHKAGELFCDGNSLEEGFGFLYRNGTVSITCSPYDQPKDIGMITTSAELPLCQDYYDKDITYCIDNESPAKVYRAMSVYKINGIPADGGSEKNIRANIFHWGPVATGFMVYNSFYQYVENYNLYGNDYIYAQDPSDPKDDALGGHAVMIVGWGNNKDGIPFWIVQNSWGDESADGGYFKIRRGNNECQIEENVIACAPDIPGAPLADADLIQPVETELDKKIREQRRVNEAGYPQDLVKEWEENGWELDTTPLVDVKNLPDYKDFWAGEIGNIDEYGKIKDTTVLIDADDRRVAELVAKARKDYSCPLCQPLKGTKTGEEGMEESGPGIWEELNKFFRGISFPGMSTIIFLFTLLIFGIIFYLIWQNIQIKIDYGGEMYPR